LSFLIGAGGEDDVTAQTTGEASPGEASFQLLAEHLPDLIIFAFDADLRMWAATGGGLRARGWTSEEFIGMTVPEIAGATRAEDIRSRCEAALAGQRTQLEMAGYDPPDRLWSLHFVPLNGGGPRGGMVLCRDVTEQRRAEKRLQASQRQLAEAQRIAQVGSWEWDLETDELTVSDELCRLFGLPVGIKLTMTEGVAAAIHPADQERVATVLGRIRDDPSPFVLEHRIIRSDGDVRTVMAHGEGVVDEDGRLVRFIGADQDITERRRAGAERRRLLNRVYEAQEGQDRRLAADLHDGHVQSLAAIGFKLEQARLRLGASGSPEVDELLWQVTKDLSAEVTSLRRTIGRLRPLVLVEDGLEAALREEAKSACNRAALVSCEVTSELDGRLDPVVETALFRVAQQALANVVDHAGATHALVAIECSARGVTLRVSDDGGGFDPDHVQVLADIAHFGLIAMRERVEALGGRFRVITAPGDGTVVEAELPLTDPIERWEP
jgi:PAS domain S-box-containing protein